MATTGKTSGSGDGLDVPKTDAMSDAAGLRDRIVAMHARHGLPGVMPPAKFAANWARICTLANAKTAAERDELQETLLYLAVVHGTGPDVAYETIEVHTTKWSGHLGMIIDGIVTRKHSRQFFAVWPDKTRKMHDESPLLQQSLLERAVRNGLPATETLSVIDFYRPQSSSPEDVSNRVRSRSSATARARNSGKTSLTNHSDNAAKAMHGYGRTTDDSIDL